MRYFIVFICILLCACAENPYTFKPGTQASLDNQQDDAIKCNNDAKDSASEKYPVHYSDASVGSSILLSSVGIAVASVTGVGFIAEPKEDEKITKVRYDFVGQYIHDCMANKGYIFHSKE